MPIYMNLDHYRSGRYINPDVLAVLEALAEEYGDKLFFLSRNTEWINFYVQGMPDEGLFRDIEKGQDDFFDEISDFQVLRPWGTSADRGVFLHHLNSPALQEEYRSGFWYY